MKSKANQMESREEEEELVHMFFHCIAVNKLIPANSSTHHTMSGSQCSFTHGRYAIVLTSRRQKRRASIEDDTTTATKHR
jgi:hypothetical protein